MRILIAAAISEGLLLIAAAVIINLAQLTVPWNANWRTVALGLALTIPPLAINQVLWRYSDVRSDSIYGRFSREIVAPLCRQMNLPISLSVAILSGVCEELFFRGALNYLCLQYTGGILSCIITSIVFAAMHFIGNFKRYGGMLPLYVGMGVYLWAAHYYTRSLAAVAVLHGTYNFIVITLVRTRTS
jgi:membrane protease YdiL (CAAX protease family)